MKEEHVDQGNKKKKSKDTASASGSKPTGPHTESAPVTGYDLHLRKAVGPLRDVLDSDTVAILKRVAGLPLGPATQQAYVWRWLAMIYRGLGMRTEYEDAQDTARTIRGIARVGHEVPNPAPQRSTLRHKDVVDVEAVEALFRMHFPDRDPNQLDVVDKALALQSVPRLT